MAFLIKEKRFGIQNGLNAKIVSLSLVLQEINKIIKIKKPIRYSLRIIYSLLFILDFILIFGNNVHFPTTKFNNCHGENVFLISLIDLKQYCI